MLTDSLHEYQNINHDNNRPLIVILNSFIKNNIIPLLLPLPQTILALDVKTYPRFGPEALY